MKKFHISDILCVISGKMVSIRNMEGLYDILNYMTDDNLHMHQLPRVMDECRPYLVERFPQLESIDVSGANDSNLLTIIERIEAEHGSYFEVNRIPEEAHKKINPIAEMFLMNKN